MAATEQGTDPLEDLSDLEETGEGSVLALADWWPDIPYDATADEAVSAIEAALQSEQADLAPEVFNFVQETSDAMVDAINDGIVPPGQSGGFWLWLAGAGGLTLIAAGSAYAITQGKILQWAQSMGWATLVGPPEPTPAVQAFIESANAAMPLPSVPVPAPVLPTPTQGQTTVVQGATGITPSTVTGGTAEGTSADQVSAALAVTFVDAMRVVASVFDAFLPNMAPGQVPEALGQLNTAVNALESQMSQVRNGVWPRGFVGLQEAVNGGLQALHGLEQQVNNLTEQMATKADSGLEDAITAVKTEADGTAAQVETILGTTVPVLEGELGTLTGQVNQLTDTVDNTVSPELAQLTTQVQANTDKLNLTDDECLEDLCDTVNNVSKPIENGGATPSLLRNLGSLLGLGWALSTLFGLMTAVATLLDAPVALQVVVEDVEQLASWAESAATSIELELPFAPGS
jgi:hypothetical protein